MLRINVGGDWYDALDIGDGRVAVAVGDVVGRGLDATTAAVRLRGALGLAAFDIRGPTEALTVLDRYAQTLRGAPGTTVASCGRRSNPGRGVLRLCRTPAPLLVSPTGDVAYLEEGRSWPLGIDVQAPRAQAGQALFPPGSIVTALHRRAHRAPGRVARRRPRQVGASRHRLLEPAVAAPQAGDLRPPRRRWRPGRRRSGGGARCRRLPGPVPATRSARGATSKHGHGNGYESGSTVSA